MAEANPTCIGRVRHVLGATVTIALDPDMAGVAPIWEGRLQPVGQVGSIVRIPQGPINLLATVTLVGIAELTGPLPPLETVQAGDRWLQVQLLGEVDSLNRFQRGVSTYPGLDDPVHFTTSEELSAVYPPSDEERVRIGCLAAAPDVTLTLDARRLVTRHGAIVGSTGSGKSSFVASLIQNLIAQGWTSANVIVIDPHGEYAAALGDQASVRSVLGEGDGLLRVPYWALPASDILRAFTGSTETATVTNRFSELVTVGRREYLQNSEWLDLDINAVTADTPVPFDLRQVWYQMDYETNATFDAQGGSGTPTIEESGDSDSLRPTRFRTYGLGGAPPFKGPQFGLYGTTADRMRLRLADSRFRFFQEPGGTREGPDPLVIVLNEWLGRDRPVSVLDFSGVPSDVTDIAIGVVLQLLFEVAVRSEETGIGRPRPVLVVLEEAHRYLGESPAVAIASRSANRIAREGRKYGVGLLLVTQRPSELPSTALAQAGSIAALRLTNATDQGTVRAALPDSVAGLADALPSLRTGECIISGEAVILPTRVLLDRPEPEPQASDPTLDSWRQPPSENQLDDAVSRWRDLPREG